jgi:hypothetical protein
MVKVRSISGDWLRLTAKANYPALRPRGQVEALAAALGISRRSCYAYIAEERRVPEPIEAKFILLFGTPLPEGWRDIDLYYRRNANRINGTGVPQLPRVKPGRDAVTMAAFRENWRVNAQLQARTFSQVALDHLLGDFVQSPVTQGEIAQAQYGLDEEEALRRFPDAYYELTDPEDWVVTCLKCGLVGSVDDRVQEINGLVFRVTCGTGSYKVGG